jgi:hypothetical protein
MKTPDGDLRYSPTAALLLGKRPRAHYTEVEVSLKADLNG